MKKSYIVIIIVFIIYTAIICFIFGNNNTTRDNTFLVTNDTVFKYEDNEWIKNSFSNELYSKNLFNVYISNKFQGQFYLSNHNDKWYYFDKNNNSYDFYGDLFATSEGVNVSVAQFTEENASIQEVNEILYKNNLSINNINELTLNKKVNYDIDDDGIDEVLYSLSNLTLNVDSEDIILFSLVVYSDNDKLTTIINDSGTVSSNEVNYFYNIYNIFKLNNDKNYKVIIKKEKIMNSSQNCDGLYEISSSTVKKLNAC